MGVTYLIDISQGKIQCRSKRVRFTFEEKDIKSTTRCLSNGNSETKRRKYAIRFRGILNNLRYNNVLLKQLS